MSSYEQYENEEYEYPQYASDAYDEDPESRPSIIDKKNRLLFAVVQNEVGVLQDLLDSPEWYNVTDEIGYTLLEIAICTDNKEVFDYMLSIPDFPIDVATKGNTTALYQALCGCLNLSNMWMRQDFAYDLIKKGASIDLVCVDGNSPLHCALDRSYHRVATLLIEKGVDVNVPNNVGYSPLSLALAMDEGVDEVVPALLMHGATPSVDMFEESVVKWRRHSLPFVVLEMLFLYLFDEYSDIQISLPVIVKLIETKSPLFYDLLKYSFKVNVKSKIRFPYFGVLCSMSIDSLKIVIEKFSNPIRGALARYNYPLPECVQDETVFMDNLNLMLSSDLRSVVISCISILYSFELFRDLLTRGITESRITKLYCFLLSYGLNISEWDLQLVYEKFNYCELFKILLHMDVNMGRDESALRWIDLRRIMPTLIYDIKMDLDRFLEHSDEYSMDSVKELFNYFVHPPLKEHYVNLVGSDAASEIRDYPEVPLLVELARNRFRKYLIEFYQIQTSRKFYTLLNHLPVNRVYKKILSYENKLYFYSS